VGPRIGLDAVSKRKIPRPRQNSNLDHSIVQPVVSRYKERALPALTVRLYSQINTILYREFRTDPGNT
jgi:hypothetical protein